MSITAITPMHQARTSGLIASPQRFSRPCTATCHTAHHMLCHTCVTRNTPIQSCSRDSPASCSSATPAATSISLGVPSTLRPAPLRATAEYIATAASGWASSNPSRATSQRSGRRRRSPPPMCACLLLLLISCCCFSGGSCDCDCC
jgi:hypothetical protein